MQICKHRQRGIFFRGMGGGCGAHRQRCLAVVGVQWIGALSVDGGPRQRCLAGGLRLRVGEFQGLNRRFQGGSFGQVPGLETSTVEHFFGGVGNRFIVSGALIGILFRFSAFAENFFGHCKNRLMHNYGKLMHNQSIIHILYQIANCS